MLTILIGAKDGKMWKYHVDKDDGTLTEFSEEEMKADRAESQEQWEKIVANVFNNVPIE